NTVTGRPWFGLQRERPRRTWPDAPPVDDRILCARRLMHRHVRLGSFLRRARGGHVEALKVVTVWAFIDAHTQRGGPARVDQPGALSVQRDGLRQAKFFANLRINGPHRYVSDLSKRAIRRDMVALDGVHALAGGGGLDSGGRGL